jgi:AraC-like DNA-binding protein
MSPRHSPPPGAGPAFAARSLQLVLGPAAARGVEPAHLLARVGLPAGVLDSPEARVPFEAVRALWGLAAEATGDADFGLHAAEAAGEGLFDVLGYLVRASPTLGEALRRLARYARLTSEPTRWELAPDADGALHVRHALEGVPGEAPRHAAECMLALVCLAARRLLGREVDPLAVHFRHPAPPRLAEHRRLFRAPLHFAQAHTALVLPASLAEARLPQGDPGLLAVLERHADALLARLPQDASFPARVRRVLCEQLRAGETGMESLARRLHLSRRTLQRRLQQEGLSFESVLDGLRRELAEAHLSEGDVPIAEVAFLLGFSDPSAFHRAFRRWTGVPPATFRRGRRAPGGAPPVR